MTIREATKLSTGKELNIAYPIWLRDKKGREVYYENSDGYWLKSEYDENGNTAYYESSSGLWAKREYDENGQEVYYANSDGYWVKRKYDENCKEVYCENSRGEIIDQRTKEMTVAEIEAQLGHKVKIVKEEK